MPKQRAPQHPDDEAVDKFARAMKRKLAKARGFGRRGWDDADTCDVDHLARCLMDEVTSDNPDMRDVANYAMFLHLRKGGRRAFRDVSTEFIREIE